MDGDEKAPASRVPLAYSVTEAAKESGLGRSLLYQLMADGELA